MGTNYARMETEGQPDGGWCVDGASMTCECKYYFNFAICIFLLFALQVKRYTGLDRKRTLVNRTVVRKRRRTQQASSNGLSSRVPAGRPQTNGHALSLRWPPPEMTTRSPPPDLLTRQHSLNGINSTFKNMGGVDQEAARFLRSWDLIQRGSTIDVAGAIRRLLDAVPQARITKPRLIEAARQGSDAGEAKWVLPGDA
ncbi:hypothetical protein F444_01959 [Phytophthora nicotianae P1976]|uniref:Uncharacterized protein n=1 Tax=Phytophthora nicotianae P1976 TaxID=1317066 RepID=A0A081AYZ7_PHYNI|nr:hypothetical protein F444_01959 [Phytophthora nicotianae P1976]